MCLSGPIDLTVMLGKNFAKTRKFLLTDSPFADILSQHARGERRVMRGSGRLLAKAR